MNETEVIWTYKYVTSALAAYNSAAPEDELLRRFVPQFITELGHDDDPNAQEQVSEIVERSISFYARMRDIPELQRPVRGVPGLKAAQRLANALLAAMGITDN